jgi:hypothetical protein
LYKNVLLDKKTRSSVFGVVHMRDQEVLREPFGLNFRLPINSDNPDYCFGSRP